MFKSSIDSGSSTHGKLAHAHMIKTAFEPSLFLQNTLVNMYCKCGELDLAHQLFDKMPQRNLVSWNSLIAGYTGIGDYQNAVWVFNEARVSRLELNRFAYASILRVCAQTGNLELGRMIHGLVLTNGLGVRKVLLANALIQMYSKCGHVGQARLVFDYSEELDGVSWNSVITGYVQSGMTSEMMRLLVKMHRSRVGFSSYVLGSVLKSCCSNFVGCEEFGKMLHGCCVKLGWELDIVVGTALLDMYAKIGDLSEATTLFRIMPSKNVVMYNAMISGLFRSETLNNVYAKEALKLFAKMQIRGIKASNVTFSAIIKACNACQEYEYGKQMHAHICKRNLQYDEFIGSSLVELYSLLGSIKDGMKCFSSTTKRDIITWTSIIMAHAQSGEFEGALSLFCRLLESGPKPDEFTISIMLSVCADLAAARSGEQIQGYAIKSGIDKLIVVHNSLLSMYAKCGDIDSARLAFESTDSPDVVSWSVIICGSAQHGRSRDALSLFELMKDHQIAPNHITFLGVLTACSHGGLVEEGLKCFEGMTRDHGLTPNEKHCACIVDLLGRAGRLADAESFILDSGFAGVPVVWRALLSACRLHKDTVMGKLVGERVIELEPEAAASYVLLYNLYNDSGMEKSATKIRDLMKERGVKKEPGVSWIEVGNRVHSFMVGDKSHTSSTKIYARLEEMLEKIKKMGFTNESHVSDACEFEERQGSAVNHHSEKLAVTLGLISLPPSAPVRVMKNLRVCQDCHTIMKFLSKLEKREIILRDRIRFHHFREGFCSCGDYW
ncbi:hypothetical protein RJ640_007605 [Escallonia rubra]|uniref:DYW domain-containing protein n=1 Tax=Escallonia rubra TaxID=112253 RepID=A0AA88QSU0_9ASTE|nr:hypothetical protein RJ640_007605 [Escallonia rubra]